MASILSPDEIKDLPNEGLQKLAKEAPEVVKRMGYEDGGVAIMIAPKQEMEEAEPMKSDEEMENDYLDFVVEESLSESEEKYLLEKLEQDDRLSQIFDKVMEVATEFAGSGAVEGPGSGVSDSIPARLSDGEFVFTAKATKEIGADKLQNMMEEAEMKADGLMERQARRAGGYMMDDVREETIQSTDPEKTYDLNKAEVEDTEKRIADAMISGGIPIR
mgnify:CR=1 FL=1|tara:strand:+ start:279 stop:932 length:654 start_codon:yes stop_codon:yes gene_type:complete